MNARDPRSIILRPVVSEKSYASYDENVYTFVVAPNGGTGYSIDRSNRFLFAQPVQPDPPITQLPVVVNWFTELRRAAGTK